MTISLNWEKGNNPVLRCMRLYAENHKIPAYTEYSMLKLHVVEFQQFLNCLWHGMAWASRFYVGDALSKKYVVVVTDHHGRKFNTRVWYDEETKGIRYGSLYFNY